MVEMELVLADGARLDIAQMGPDFVILSHPLSNMILAKTSGVVSLGIDGSWKRWRVEVAHDHGPGNRRLWLSVV
jgi:hypothetical protein